MADIIRDAFDIDLTYPDKKHDPFFHPVKRERRGATPPRPEDVEAERWAKYWEGVQNIGKRMGR